MLEKSTSIKRPLFGLFGLSCLVKQNQPDEPDRPEKPDRPGLSQTCGPATFWRAHIVFPQPAKSPVGVI
jgi:hypothetical protein